MLAGCGGPVEVAPAPAATSDACTSAASAWPEEVAGAARADTRPASGATAAWAAGADPAIIGRCGVPVPGPTTLECIAVDDVDWIAERLDDGMRFTTYGRDPAVEILVPDHYAPEPLVLSAFGTVAGLGEPTGHRCR
ncbi:DUF3515 family protein [Mobilicoccus caccae]|nr:DUF3515 family protein [Mobilicoccus caccae]